MIEPLVNNPELQQMVSTYLHETLRSICPEPLLSMYLTDMKPIPETHINIHAYFDPKENTSRKIIEIYFKNNRIGRATFTTHYTSSPQGQITCENRQDPVRMIPVKEV